MPKLLSNGLRSEIMATHQPEEEYADPLRRLRKAHFAISQVLLQVDGIVQTASKLDAQKKICDYDLFKLSELLEATASSLQEWIPRLKDRLHAGRNGDLETENDGFLPLLPEFKEVPEDAAGASKRISFSTVQSKTLENHLEQVDAMLDDKRIVLSDSPLLPWLDKVQFFILTPMGKPKQDSWPVLLSKKADKGQEALNHSSQGRLKFSQLGIMPVDLSPSLEACADKMPEPTSLPSTVACDSVLCEPGALSDGAAVSAAAAAAVAVATPCDSVLCEPDALLDGSAVSAAAVAVATPSHLVRQCNAECTETMGIPSPSCFQSLVKRYSKYPDSSPSPPITPGVTQNQDEHEGTEITEYFTAFTPLKSLAPYMSRSAISPLSVDSSPKGKAAVDSVQKLIERYSQCLHTEEEKVELADSALNLTPIFASSPPKTCVLMRPSWKDSSKKSLRTPVLVFQTPFRTPANMPAINLSKYMNHSFYEDMELISEKRPLQLPLPLEIEKTPSSDMQFATITKVLKTMNRTPLVDRQLSTAQKPGARLPGEQTLKRELWCLMEAEFASMTHVCKSLFNEPANDAVMKAGIEGRRQTRANKLK